MSCPKCNSENVEKTGLVKYSCPAYIEYECQDCKCKFDVRENDISCIDYTKAKDVTKECLKEFVAICIAKDDYPLAIKIWNETTHELDTFYKDKVRFNNCYYMKDSTDIYSKRIFVNISEQLMNKLNELKQIIEEEIKEGKEK